MAQLTYTSPLLPRWTPASFLDYEPYTLDLTLALVGETIVGTPVVTIVGTDPAVYTPPIVSAIAASGALAIFWLTGGTPDDVYTVSVSVTTSGGRKLTRSALLPIADYR